jgi:hypothetical protein
LKRWIFIDPLKFEYPHQNPNKKGAVTKPPKNGSLDGSFLFGVFHAAKALRLAPKRLKISVPPLAGARRS